MSKKNKVFFDKGVLSLFDTNKVVKVDAPVLEVCDDETETDKVLSELLGVETPAPFVRNIGINIEID